MKFFPIALLVFCCTAASAQNTRIKREITIKIIDRDSVVLHYDNEFALTDDTCSKITRFGHFSEDQKLDGAFEDHNSANPTILLTKGAYTEGLKQGPFIINFPDGKLQAKGEFKNNRFFGKWEVFYANDKPRIFFEADGNAIKITDAWDEKGVKTIANGSGFLKTNDGITIWQGKLVNGLPDGTWKSKRVRDDENVNTEYYKNGAFQSGHSLIKEYTDSTRLALVTTNMFKFVQAERFLISTADCDGNKTEEYSDAHYSSRMDFPFSTYLSNSINNALSGLDITAFDGRVIIEGEFGKDGAVKNLRTRETISEVVTEAVKKQIRQLPALVPATINGKPAKQKFSVTILMSNRTYRFSYQFAKPEKE
ncbi:hypothetical protein D0C36_07125 [Mucilaginibacter conchicola]|uniref:MORN repeat variant n=1 Tax=Mucilaginibacter conchicola TaxID=2303333 RepID=A0A372NYV6_9SPHI|nr:hypothetical protein [Mucilaginibacter conchicola]RFZ95293.1 hypothetical protein D0C36_07125 [Mucilaginibacter conchicola]